MGDIGKAICRFIWDGAFDVLMLFVLFLRRHQFRAYVDFLTLATTPLRISYWEAFVVKDTLRAFARRPMLLMLNNVVAIDSGGGTPCFVY